MPFVVDGYNLLRYIEKNFEEDGRITDVVMCRLIGQFIAQRREIAAIVFDGIGPPDKQGFYGLENIEVYFSGTDKEADDIIIQMIKENTAPKRLAVVSDDREIRKEARKRKAIEFLCYDFWMTVKNTLARKRTRKKEPSAKRLGITEKQTDEWMKEFGF